MEINIKQTIKEIRNMDMVPYCLAVVFAMMVITGNIFFLIGFTTINTYFLEGLLLIIAGIILGIFSIVGIYYLAKLYNVYPIYLFTILNTITALYLNNLFWSK